MLSQSINHSFFTFIIFFQIWIFLFFFYIFIHMYNFFQIWNADSFEVLGTLNGHSKGVWSVQFSPTDYLVATSSADATIKLWSLSTYDNVAVSILKINIY